MNLSFRLTIAFFATFSLSFPFSVFGIDIERGVRNVQRHQHWMSLEIRTPSFGMFLASRASIEDKRIGTTLNFTFLPKKQCRNVSVLVLQLDSPAGENIRQSVPVEVQIDDDPNVLLSSTLLVNKGATFAFYDISNDFNVRHLFGRYSAVFTLRGVGLSEFPLMGFTEAWKRARTLCEGFISTGPSKAVREPSRSSPQFDPLIVKRIQSKLLELGYDPGPSDGVYGPRTREAISKFQKDHNLPTTGRPSAELAVIVTAMVEPIPDAEKSPDTLTVAGGGTGFTVNEKGLLITNRHVIEDCASIKVKKPTEHAIKANVIAESEELDLALLETGKGVTEAAPFRDGKGVRPGNLIVVYGFPLSGALAATGNVTTGTVTALAGLADDPNTLQISAPIQPGNSGGPLLDSSGNVVGVVSSKLNAVAVARITGDLPQNVNFAIKRTTTLNFLDAHGVDYVLQPSTTRLQPADVGEAAKGFTYKIECYR